MLVATDAGQQLIYCVSFIDSRVTTIMSAIPIAMTAVARRVKLATALDVPTIRAYLTS